MEQKKEKDKEKKNAYNVVLVVDHCTLQKVQRGHRCHYLIVCVCVCVCITMCVFVCVCVCVCVCKKKNEGGESMKQD